MTHEEFKKSIPLLTETLATAFETKLIEMGDKVAGISWFCSSAMDHPENA